MAKGQDERHNGNRKVERPTLSGYNASPTPYNKDSKMRQIMGGPVKGKENQELADKDFTAYAVTQMGEELDKSPLLKKA